MIDGYALGIDLGSKYTAAALFRAGAVEVAQLGEHAHVAPTVVYRCTDGELLVGDAARRRAQADPSASAQDFKRDLGDDVPHLLGDHAVSSTDLAAAVLRFVLRTVAEQQGEAPAAVTVTCPASWGAHRRGELAKAAADAGLPGAGLLEEPVAAAACYASRAHRRIPTGTLIGVYDLGGATFDVAIVRKVADGFAACGRPGGADLGGMDFDDIVLGHVLDHSGVVPSLPPDDDATLLGLARLRADAIDRKEALSTDTEVVVPVLLPGVASQVRMTREEFEERGAMLLSDTIDTFREVLGQAGITVAQLDRVLLVGGASRMPLVARMLAAGLPGVQLHVDEHPKWAVCLGAAMAAGARLLGAHQPGPLTRDAIIDDGRAASSFAPPPVDTEALAASDALEAELLVLDEQPPAARAVDLVELGLDGVRDVPLRSALRRARPVEVDEPLVVEVTGPAGFDRRRVVLVGVLVLAVLALLVLISAVR